MAPRAGGDRPAARARRIGLAGALAFCVAVGVLGSCQWILGEGDGASILVLVEDGGGEERRADSFLILRWWRACDHLEVTSVPRDLVLRTGEESLAVRSGTDGRDAVAADIAQRFGLSFAAVVTLTVDDIAALASEIGPVPVELARESRDRLTGFHAGPGTVWLDGDGVIPFLRARRWEELVDGHWIAVGAGDRSRIDNTQRYLRGAVGIVATGTLVRHLGLAAIVAGSADVDVREPAGLLGFGLGARAVRGIDFAVVRAEPERTVDERRSPFEPEHLGAAHRLVSTGDPTVPASRCAESSR